MQRKMAIFETGMTVYPNPKINLGLSVIRKRADGYHELETLFVPYFGVRDVLEIEPAEEFGIEISEADWDPRTDLTAKAWDLLHAELGIPPVHIRLTKNIPVGAGLGGGSADAAFALRALNDIFNLKLSDDTLAAYAARLGSDCAFFIYNRPMLGTGRGEILTPFDIDLADYELVVEMPAGEHVSTKEAYGGIIPREVSSKVSAPLLEALAQPIDTWRDVLVNDFEATVFPLHPAIAELKAQFYAKGAVYASMSGSGASVFGLFKKQ